MRKVLAAFNMTIDGNCDHTIPNPDAEIHVHYTNLLKESGVVLYGRNTFELMKYWQTFLSEPSKEKSMNDFAVTIDQIQKIVFSTTMDATGWESACLSYKPLQEKIMELKKLPGKDVLIGSRSLIIQLLNLNLIDELQLCIYPIIAGQGLQLFENIHHRIDLTHRWTKSFKSGAVIYSYKCLPKA